MKKEHEEVSPVENTEATTPENYSEPVSSVDNGNESLMDKVNRVLNTKVGNFSVKMLICAVIAVLIVILACSALFGGDEELPDYPLVYLNDEGDLMVVGKKGDPKRITSEGSNVVYSNTSTKYILFTKKGNLYIYNLNKKDDPEKIASDVDEYGFSLDDKYVYYLKDNGDLYAYDMKDTYKLDSNVEDMSGMYIEDAIIYEKEDSLYIRGYREKDDKEKISSKVDSLLGVSKNGKKVLYSETETDDDDEEYEVLYMYNVKKNKSVKITDDYDGVLRTDDNYDKIYYLVGIKDEDEDGYGYSSYKVMVYDGKNSKELVKGIDDVVNVDIDDDTIVYTVKDDDDDEVTYTSYVYHNGKEIELYDDEVSGATIVGKEIYFTVREDNEDSYDSEYELYYGKISGAKVKDVKSIDEGLAYSTVNEILEDGKVYYFVDVDEDEVGDLKYAKGGKAETVQSDLYSEVLEVKTDKSGFYLVGDYKDNSGDLYECTGSKAKKVASDVNDLIYINSDYMFLKKNYSNSSGTFDLYYFNGKKEKKVAQDVSYVEERGLSILKYYLFY